MRSDSNSQTLRDQTAASPKLAKKKKGFMHLVLLDLLQRVSSCLVFTAAGVAQVQRDYS